MADPLAEEAAAIQQMATELVAGTKVVGTTFSDLFFGNFNDPWSLVAIGVTSALVGMFTHWAKVYFKEPNTVGFYQWFFVTNKRGTIIAVLTTLGALFAAFGPLDYTTITAYQVFAQAWTIGYTADSVFNSANRNPYGYSTGYDDYTPGYRDPTMTGSMQGFPVGNQELLETPDYPPSASHM